MKFLEFLEPCDFSHGRFRDFIEQNIKKDIDSAIEYIISKPTEKRLSFYRAIIEKIEIEGSGNIYITYSDIAQKLMKKDCKSNDNRQLDRVKNHNYESM